MILSNNNILGGVDASHLIVSEANISYSYNHYYYGKDSENYDKVGDLFDFGIWAFLFHREGILLSQIDSDIKGDAHCLYLYSLLATLIPRDTVEPATQINRKNFVQNCLIFYYCSNNDFILGKIGVEAEGYPDHLIVLSFNHLVGA